MTSSLQEIDIQTNAPQYGRCSKRSVLRVHNSNLSGFGGAQWKKGSPMLKAEKQDSNIFCAKTQLCIELLSEVGMSWMTWLNLAGKLLLSTVIVVFWSSLNANSAGSEEHLNHWHWQGHHDLPWSAKYGLQRGDSILGRPLGLQAGNQSSIDRRRCLIENAASVWVVRFPNPLRKWHSWHSWQLGNLTRDSPVTGHH